MKRTTTTPATPRTSTRTASATRAVKSRAPKTTAARAAALADAETSATVTESAIAMRAYEIFLARNGEPGDPVSDWLQAERELRAL